MLKVSKILVPMAFTAACQRAAKYAVGLADRLGSELHVVHVIEPLVPLFGMEPAAISAEVENVRRAAAERELALMLGTAIPAARASIHVVEGDAGIEIVRLAHNEKMDLIVMPTRGHSPVRRLLLGSVTAKVLHDSSVVVWTGAHLECGSHSDPGSINAVVCAIDLGPQSVAVLRSAKDVAEEYGAALYVLHVTPTGPDANWRKQAARVAEEQIVNLLADMEARAEVQVLAGTVHSNVVLFARSIEAGLVVIGRGCGDVGGRLPSQAYAIIRDCPCPVFSV
jgi:nucleotide-binding universal stress UspA family protein